MARRTFFFFFICLIWYEDLLFIRAKAELFEDSKCRDRPENYAVGGTDVQHGGEAYTVSLFTTIGNEKTFSCGGSLISPNHVLTAAHCIFQRYTLTTKRGDTSKNITIVLGATNWKENKGVSFQIENFEVHPSYNRLEETHDGHGPGDLAVIRLADPDGQILNLFISCQIDVIKLPKDSEEAAIGENQNVVALGWGITKPGGHDHSDISSHLKQVNLKYMPRDQCLNKWPHLPNGSFCAVANEGKDLCKYDSGGPILIRKREGNKETSIQIGVTQSGDNICGTNISHPSIYTDIVYYGSWIKEAVEKLGCWVPFEQLDRECDQD